MEIFKQETTTVKREIPDPSYFKHSYCYEDGEHKYFIKVQKGKITTIGIQYDDYTGNFYSYTAEEWDQSDSDFFEWKESSEEEFLKKKKKLIECI